MAPKFIAVPYLTSPQNIEAHWKENKNTFDQQRGLDIVIFKSRSSLRIEPGGAAVALYLVLFRFVEASNTTHLERRLYTITPKSNSVKISFLSPIKRIYCFVFPFFSSHIYFVAIPHMTLRKEEKSEVTGSTIVFRLFVFTKASEHIYRYLGILAGT